MSQVEPPASGSGRDNDAFVRRAKSLAWTMQGIQVASTCLTLIILGLTIFLVGLATKEWLFGKTHTFHFDNIQSPQRTRAEFEAEFAKRLSGRGYKVEKVRVTYESSDREFDGEIILINVPSKTPDSTLWMSVHEVMSSLKDKHLPVEK